MALHRVLTGVRRAILAPPAGKVGAEDRHPDAAANCGPCRVLLTLLFGDPSALVVAAAIGGVAIQRANGRHLSGCCRRYDGGQDNHRD